MFWRFTFNEGERFMTKHKDIFASHLNEGGKGLELLCKDQNKYNGTKTGDMIFLESCQA